MDMPSQQWNARIAQGDLHHDPVQEQALARLDALSRALKTWRPGPVRRLFRRPAKPPKGLYLHGPVGRGKSMLMDMFFNTAPIAGKRRVHFLPFMQEVHAALAHWRGLNDRQRRQQAHYQRGDGDDPIAPIARAIARQSPLLCFDEFQVTNIADAMILGRLFEQLFTRHAVVVATSNVAPDDLYKDGLNHQRFAPFIEVVKAHMDVLALDTDTDYRLNFSCAEKTYNTPLGPKTTKIMDDQWAALTNGLAVAPHTLTLKNREWHIPHTAGGNARLDFATACEEARGPADYLELARNFHTIMIDNVPVFDNAHKAAGLRFIALIDALYEARTKIIISAAAAPDALYRADNDGFAFARTASRLHEMQSPGFINAGHGNKDIAV